MILKPNLNEYCLIIKQDETRCSLQEVNLNIKKNRLRVKSWKKLYYDNINQKKAKVAIKIVPEKLEF